MMSRTGCCPTPASQRYVLRTARQDLNAGPLEKAFRMCIPVELMALASRACS